MSPSTWHTKSDTKNLECDPVWCSHAVFKVHCPASVINPVDSVRQDRTEQWTENRTLSNVAFCTLGLTRVVLFSFGYQQRFFFIFNIKCCIELSEIVYNVVCREACKNQLRLIFLNTDRTQVVSWCQANGAYWPQRPTEDCVTPPRRPWL